MSWFPDDFEACRLDIEPEQGGVEPAGHEFAPGVEVERSGVFTLPRRASFGAAGAAAALLAHGASLRAQDPKRRGPESGDRPASSGSGFGPITLEQFIAEAEPLAEALVAEEDPNEDAYLMYLASLVCRLGECPAFDKESERPVQMKRSHRGPRFAILQIKIAEGAALPFRDHYEYNGLILGLEGTVHARNFEMAGNELRPPEDARFEIRETVRATLTPGRISTLSRRRDNIHDLRGGAGGGRVLDIFTFFPDTGGSRYMELEDSPVHMHDLHATILHLLGLDHERLTYRFAGRDFRLTDVAGRIVHELFA